MKALDGTLLVPVFQDNRFREMHGTQNNKLYGEMTHNIIEKDIIASSLYIDGAFQQ